MKIATAAAAITLLAFAGYAHATPALIGQAVVPIATATAAGGDAVSGPSTGGAATSDQHNDSTSVGAAVGQAPSAPAPCVTEVRLLFGLAQWTDTSPRQCAAILAQAAIASGDRLAIDQGLDVLVRFKTEAWPVQEPDTRP